MINKILHPGYFFYEKDSKYSKYFEEIKTWMTEDETNLLYKIEDLIKFSASEILKFNPTQEIRDNYKRKGIVVKEPVIIFFIEKGETYPDQLSKISDNSVYKEISLQRFKFYNIFIRDLERGSPGKDFNQFNFNLLEDFLQTHRHKLPLADFYNIIVDNFNEKSNIKLSEDSDFIFTQLSEFLFFLLHPAPGDNIMLGSCNQPVKDENKSPVCYNAFGMANMGFNLRKVRQCTGLLRKATILSGTVSDYSPETSSEHSALSGAANTFSGKIEKNYRGDFIDLEYDGSFSKYLQNECSFKEEEAGFYEYIDYRKQVELFATSFKAKLPDMQRVIVRRFEEIEYEIFDETKKIISYFLDITQKSSIDAALYFMNEFSTKGEFEALSKKNDTELRAMLSETIEKAEQDDTKENPFPFAETENILRSLNEAETGLKKFAGEIDEFQGLRKNNFLKYFLKNIFRSRLMNHTKQQFFKYFEEYKGLLKFYVESYNRYFNDYIVNKKLSKSKALKIMLMIFFHKQILSLTRFKKIVSDLHATFDSQYKNFELEKDYFNLNLVGGPQIEYYCNQYPLNFFDNHPLSAYFNEFSKESNYFSTLFSVSELLEKEEKEIIRQNNLLSYPSQAEYVQLKEEEVGFFLQEDFLKYTDAYRDVKQGNLNDCYFLAALAGLAAKTPGLLTNILYQEENKVAVIFHDEVGKPHKIYLDLKFWVDPVDNEPIYARFGSEVNEKKELWPMILEKAWAKINGLNYESINYDSSKSKIRRIDYSIALTGNPALREPLNRDTFSDDTVLRVTCHTQKGKPIVLYSITAASENREFHSNINPDHAYALLNVRENVCQFYDTLTGSCFDLNIMSIALYFDEVIYFNVDLSTDTYLLGYYTEYFTQHTCTPKSITNDLDAENNRDFDDNVNKKSLEQILAQNVFNIEINSTRIETFSEKIVETSIPFVYLEKPDNTPYTYYFLGKNVAMQKRILERLKTEHNISETVESINSNSKKMGLLRIRNNLKLENIC